MQSKRANKRGQVTLFIIIAVVIVAVVVLFIVLRRPAAPEAPAKPFEPKSYVTDCVKNALPGTFFVDFGCSKPNDCYEDIPYFCYNTVSNKDCIIQRPEVLNASQKEQVLSNISACIESFSDYAEGKGYDVNYSEINFTFSSSPDSITIHIECSMSIKNKITTLYDAFDITLPCKNCISWPQSADKFLPLALNISDYESRCNINNLDTGCPNMNDILNNFLGFTVLLDTTDHYVTVYTINCTEELESFSFAIREGG